MRRTTTLGADSRRIFPHAVLALFVGCALLSLVPGCGEPAPAPRAAAPPPDLAGIRERGELRILVQRRSESWLPRRGFPLDAERERAFALARDLDLSPRLVPIDDFDLLIPALLAGRGDLIVENLTITEGRRERVAFSTPVALVREQVVTRADDEALRGPPDLASRTIAVQRSSSFWDSALALQARHPGLAVEAADEKLDTDGLLDSVASGKIDLTLMDSNVMDAISAWRQDLRTAIDLTEPRMIAWAMRPDARELRTAVDSFLAASGQATLASGRSLHRDDLAQIQERGFLRVLTRNNSTSYFISRGQLMGFEYDLAKKFAAELGVRLQIVVPPTGGDLLPWLREGKGDLIAAGMTATPERAAREQVVFSRMYQEVRNAVVARADADVPRSLEDLDGRTFAVRHSSSYWQTLKELQQEGARFEVVAAPEAQETEEIISHVASGTRDLTLADSHIVAAELSWREDIVTAFEFGEAVNHGWVVRPESLELLGAINAFFDREYRGMFYNVTRKKYFGSPKGMRKKVAARPHAAGSISPYDDLARRYATRYGFDWRMIVAQMYQESRFDPNARSRAGALGLLQVMPRTAAELGYERLSEPEIGIQAGIEYLSWVRERFPDTSSDEDRLWLTLAAYNVGFGHVRDARRIAAQRGWDPDRWFDHVERAMLLKERPEVHRNTRFGYARGREPVAYVREIQNRYRAYARAATQID